ncbi:MAG TPA: hypothetical protein ENK38_01290 [Gammaproteobacteria bacterium]|nr:hypothetical protein [Gammaproteobacteria bacterium]
MVWSVDNNLEVDLAAQVATAFANGSVQFYDGVGALLATCPIASATPDGSGNVVLVFTSAAVVAGIANASVASATFFKSNGTTSLLSTNSVGTTPGNDINFDSGTGWNAGDSIQPGNVTLNLTNMTAT